LPLQSYAPDTTTRKQLQELDIYREVMVLPEKETKREKIAIDPSCPHSKEA
jgi:hypothetical protein